MMIMTKILSLLTIIPLLCPINSAFHLVFRTKTYRVNLRQQLLSKIATRAVSTSSEPNNNENVNTSGVTFQYSPTSLLHLKTLDESWTPKRGVSTTWTKEKTFLVIASSLCATAGYSVTTLLTNQPITDGDAISVFVGLFCAILSWKFFGGDSIRQQELPKDGGYDARFVVDRPPRLAKLLDHLKRQSPEKVLQSQPEKDRDLSTALRLMEQVHDSNYLEEIKTAVQDAERTDRIRRLNPIIMRTLLDKHTYDAAVHSVADWIDAVDAAVLQKPSPVFALTRPPSHHACKFRGMGGCFLNSPAIAAFYALERGVQNVAILDIDAHHGNGIAHCIQEEPRIRYCSIHEFVPDMNWFKSKSNNNNSNEEMEDKKDPNPRKPDADDRGPLRNCLNVPLEKQTGWNNGYRDALETKALPWLCENDPDILIVAAGFDALAADGTSGLQLQPSDYEELGQILLDKFGRRIAFGLEGGYCWQNGELVDAVESFVKPWG